MFKILPNIFHYKNKCDSNLNRNALNAQSTTLSGQPQQDTFVKRPKEKTAPNWVKDPVIVKAFDYLKGLEFNPEDIKYIQSVGVVLPFTRPKDAVKFINDNNIRIKFAPLESERVHAQYDYDTNFIEINELYQNTENPAEFLAISEAILHEVGHAKDKDGNSSVQEEMDCLAMNALSHRVLSKKYPDIFDSVDSLIVKDGVCVYPKLYFDEDSTKQGLVDRLKFKYGDLPAGDSRHPAQEIATRVKS